MRAHIDALVKFYPLNNFLTEAGNLGGGRGGGSSLLAQIIKFISLL